MQPGKQAVLFSLILKHTVLSRPCPFISSKKGRKRLLPFESLWVSSWMSNSLANAVRSGGITQQEARFTWLLLGLTWTTTQDTNTHTCTLNITHKMTPVMSGRRKKSLWWADMRIETEADIPIDNAAYSYWCYNFKKEYSSLSYFHINLNRLRTRIPKTHQKHKHNAFVYSLGHIKW